MNAPKSLDECELYDKIISTVIELQKTQGWATMSEICSKSGIKNCTPYVQWLYINQHLILYRGTDFTYQLAGVPNFVKDWDRKAAEKKHREKRETEMEAREKRIEQRDIEKVELQRRITELQQQNVKLKKRSNRLAGISCLVGIIVGASTMWSFSKKDTSSDTSQKDAQQKETQIKSDTSNLPSVIDVPPQQIDSLIK